LGCAFEPFGSNTSKKSNPPLMGFARPAAAIRPSQKKALPPSRMATGQPQFKALFLSLFFRADLYGFHAGLGFGLGLEYSVVNDRGCRGGRLLVNNAALLGRGITHYVELGCLRKYRRDRKSANRANSRRLSILLDMRSPVARLPFQDGPFLDRALVANRTTRNGFYSLLNRPGLPSPREPDWAASC
jgi:hypothetical protein